MRSEVRAAAAQIDVKWFDPQANLMKVREFMERLAAMGGADLVVFPELANSGYVRRRDRTFGYDYHKLAETLDGPFVRGVAQTAREHRCFVAIGLLEAHPTIPATAYNSAVLLSPSGDVVGVHHKMHLPGDERQYFYAGSTTTVVATELGNIGLLVCADRRFPELGRMLALKGAEIICCPTNSPSAERATDPERAYAFGRCRALENGIFWVESNRVGQEGDYTFTGHSCIAAPDGGLLAKSTTVEEDLIQAVLLEKELSTTRAMVPNFRDRRPELYSPLIQMA